MVWEGAGRLPETVLFPQVKVCTCGRNNRRVQWDHTVRLVGPATRQLTLSGMPLEGMRSSFAHSRERESLSRRRAGNGESSPPTQGAAETHPLQEQAVLGFVRAAVARVCAC